MAEKKDLTKEEILEQLTGKQYGYPIDPAEHESELLLYIDSPFCPRNCAFCRRTPHILVANELAKADDDKHGKYLKALAKEIRSSAPGFEEFKIPAIRIAGGVPGGVYDEALADLIVEMRDLFDLHDNKGNPAEITVKVRPDMLNEETLDALERAGVSRLSVEFISADAHELEVLGFQHKAGGKRDADADEDAAPKTPAELKEIFAKATEKFTLDFDVLIGIPGQTTDTFMRTLQTALELGASHLSLFRLMLINGTPFARTYAPSKNKKPGTRVLEPLEGIELFRLAEVYLTDHGFEQYLPGFYAKPGFESRYRQHEFDRVDVLGFGLSAETVFEKVWTRTTSNMETYLKYSDNPEKVTAEIRPQDDLIVL